MIKEDVVQGKKNTPTTGGSSVAPGTASGPAVDVCKGRRDRALQRGEASVHMWGAGTESRGPRWRRGIIDCGHM